MDIKKSNYDVISYIVKQIKQNKWDINEKIYSENQLALKLGVSRHTVRKAYSVLEGVGIIESIHGDGTYLKKFKEINNESPISLLMMLLNEDIEKLMEFRKIIEVGMVSTCIYNINSSDIEKLKLELNLMKTEKEYSEISKHDIKIHSIICESIGNPFLSFVYNMTIGYLSYISENNWKEIFEAEDSNVKNELIELHEEIVNSIIERNCEYAKVASENHLNYIEKNLNKFV